METKKHKRKTNHVVIVTSDAVDAGVRQFHFSHLVFQILVVVVCVAIGCVAGRIIYEEQYKAQIWAAANEKIAEVQAVNEQLQEQLLAAETERQSLESEIADLNSKITILSDTVNQKTDLENELKEQLEQQSTPTLFPLTGSASIEEITEGEPTCIFNGTEGTTVVATAQGVVTEVTEDADYGNRVLVDHGNGYVTIYRNSGDCMVKVGDTVAQGTTLFLIGSSNTRLGYQIRQDGEYINPMQMMEISG